ncbi:MFS transporter [Rhodococcus sp. BP-252]|uniref:thiamine pyrophosphate-dependent enzyme n=1 Tax=unclassified Rhodococcus (in: high G+C Gram-positive bacteria) TaxID=192944 RepID=UPI001C9AF8CA|nr:MULTISPECIES: thiamine pyrophosphate-dependent enzyme [unclassified Rhodococcus (in: high G+C Gram-positive bacteria)]MBY6414197.1 MFS transporter [Rhodococcus sp. BP-320]MBY6418939.1 MFS transporter [Rhodococcus sp. BP-321]MBY6423692.1 MFS transporter [Rhodococcus sp. BP-324]MBY6429002.1 MFS transporter [Rhodococcus sp. BP-323]MBY6434007.1 MFS transporter [Rhodococcus sp. BP-322]
MAEAIDEYFLEHVGARSSRRSLGSLTPERALELFDAQLGSRHLDLAARWLRSESKGYYTIGSSGHEGNAAVAGALGVTDPALLHYRSGAFFLERARQGGGSDPIRDVLLGLVAAVDEPISGGRHKVFGRADLAVIPQTSTIASHLPRAVGVAFSTVRARKLGVPCPWPGDAVTACSFGDASANHSTALGAFNTAVHSAYQGVPLPILFVCEDNGLGISVPTPAGWIASNFSSRPGLDYVHADGSDLVDTYEKSIAAVDRVRRRRRPVFLHIDTVRLMGHAGSDVESSYRSRRDITADYARDPVLQTARTLIDSGVLTASDAVALYEEKRAEVMDTARDVADASQLATADAVMAPLAYRAVASSDAIDLPAESTLAQAINASLRRILDRYPQAVLFGEDVARKGGVYGVTRGLLSAAGSARVFDTVLDEQSILGLAAGAGVSGLLPIAEIQYLAYLHNAADQIRGEAATLQFFSNGQYRNPMIVRIAGYGYQKGFGGHFHNDNAVAALRDIPGIVVASPARGDDAAAMLDACASAAVEQGAVCVFLEPIALYHTRDLYEDGDDGWLSGGRVEAATIGRARVYGEGGDLTIITFGNGVPMSLRAAQRLSQQGVHARVVDMRWLAPLPVDDVVAQASATSCVLVVDETRRSGGVGEGVIAALVDAGYTGKLARIASENSFIPLGDAALHVLVSQDRIVDAAVSVLS